MQLIPILASLRRHRLTACLLALQIALAFALTCNALFLVQQRVRLIDMPSGVAEQELVVIRSEFVDDKINWLVQDPVDLAALRGIAGVTAAAAVDSLPLSGGESAYAVCSDIKPFLHAKSGADVLAAGCPAPAAIGVAPSTMQALGLHLIAGRDFLPQEYVDDDKVPAVILSAALAQRLFPDRPALGALVYYGNKLPTRVVGIVSPLLRPRLNGFGSNGYVMLMPTWSVGTYEQYYVLRTAPAERERVLREAREVLFKTNPMRLLPEEGSETFSQLRRDAFRRDVNMIGMLVGACVALLFVTALGVSGLANFWVQQRRRQIGIRRAIGATRGQILRYFLLENMVIVGAGLVPGVIAAVGLNLYLMRMFEVPQLPWIYLPVGCIGLWLLGLLSAWWPALRASRVAPVVAMRTA